MLRWEESDPQTPQAIAIDQNMQQTSIYCLVADVPLFAASIFQN